MAKKRIQGTDRLFEETEAVTSSFSEAAKPGRRSTPKGVPIHALVPNRHNPRQAYSKETLEELIHIPIVGQIVASEPVPVPETTFSYVHPDSMIDVARNMLPGRSAEKLFALEVSGDSMIDAMVNDGDIVIMQPPHEQVKNGDMVAVWLNDRDETTLKYFYHENGGVRLQPANPTMSPIYIDDASTVEIQGKVVMVVRQMENQ